MKGDQCSGGIDAYSERNYTTETVGTSIPVSFEKIILKCTQKKPERRYASARELIADLRKVLTHPDGRVCCNSGGYSSGQNHCDEQQ